METGQCEDAPDSSSQRLDSDTDQRVYFVPYRWWKDAQDSVTSEEPTLEGKVGVLYTASHGSHHAGPLKYLNSIFSSELAFNLRKKEELCNGDCSGEVGFSGRDFALVPGDMWLEALKWHSVPKSAKKDEKSLSSSEDDMCDVYPLQIRLSVLRETNSLSVKICKKDNETELFRRACKIFSIDSEMLRIWDFSRQTTLYLNDKNKLIKEIQRQSDPEILLELQIYGLSDNMRCKEGKKYYVISQHSNGIFSSGLIKMNDINGNARTSSFSSFPRIFGEAGSLGLTGLQNLGNTCFMNSAIQCLAHTAKLVDYFLGDYAREINHDSPLGMNGEIAVAFGDLIRKLWAPGATPVVPRTFKSKLARFAPRFSGYNQNDSQELLAFLLDGLHEDLNRVKLKPYIEAKDGAGRPDSEVADEYWQNHVACNDSIIVDVCQGQYKSTLVCPICKMVSVTFDPFMYLSLPLPSTNTRSMTLTVISTEGNTKPSPYTISVPKDGKLEDLIQILSSACSLGSNENLLVAEVFNNRIIRYLEDPSDSLSLIRDGDQLVAYCLTKDADHVSTVVFMHHKMEGQYIFGKLSPNWRAFGIPLVGTVSNSSNGIDIHNLYLKLLNPFGMPDNSTSATSDTLERTALEDVQIELSCGREVESPANSELQFYFTDERGKVKQSIIARNEPVPETRVSKRFYVIVCWPEKQDQKYNTDLFTSLPEVFKSGFYAKRPSESVSLYNCLEAFLKEEPLGREDMWYCPGCKKHRQASKMLDLWRLPEVLVIHLKRFSYNHFLKNKLETFVDFPFNDLDLSTYVSSNIGLPSHRYVLYAISNHYGSMGGGHYTAFVHHEDQWYDFDDSLVRPINQDKIKTSAAYVLFYKRIGEAPPPKE